MRTGTGTLRQTLSLATCSFDLRAAPAAEADRILGTDVEAQAAVRDAQRGFRLDRARRPRKHESQITCSVGRRRNDLTPFCRDARPCNAGHRARIVNAFQPAVDAAARMGSSSPRPRLVMIVVRGQSAQYHQAHAEGMSEHAPAQSPDGAGGYFEHPDPLAVEPHLGVNRSGDKPGRAASTRHVIMNVDL